MKLILVLVIALLPACSAAPPKPDVPKLVNCAGSAVVSAVASIMPEVEKALSGGETDWSAAIERLIPIGKDAVICALQAWASGKVAGAPEVLGVTSVGGGAVHPLVKSTRAQAWLSANGYR